MFLIITAILIVAAVAYGVWRYRVVSTTRVQTESSIIEAKPPKTKPLHNPHFSLSVLLFEAASENVEVQLLASGITLEIIQLVTKVPDIRVGSRLSAYQFRSGKADIQKIAKQLNTRYVLTGSLKRVGDQIGVIAQLTDVSTNKVIWSQTYDHEIDDLFAVKDDIVKCIVGAVLGEVKLVESLFAGATPTWKLDAWGLVQKAYHFWLTNFSAEGILEACEYLRQAITIEPGYANARAALAMLLAQQMTTRICEDYDACTREASELIEKAYQQAPNDIDVLENAGVTWQNLGESEKATKALRKAVKLAPLNLISRGYLALLLGFTGGERGAKEAQQIIYENFATAPSHPSVPYWMFFLAVAEQRLGNSDTAIDLAKQSLAGQPMWVHNYFIIANAYCLVDDRESAFNALREAAKINPVLTAQLFAENVYRIVGGSEKAEPFVGGLKKHKLVE